MCYSAILEFWLYSSYNFVDTQRKSRKPTVWEGWETYVLPNGFQCDLSNHSILHLLNDNVVSLLRNGECDQCLCGVWHPVPGLHQQHGSDRSQHQRRPLYQVKLHKYHSVLFLTSLKLYSAVTQSKCFPHWAHACTSRSHNEKWFGSFNYVTVITILYFLLLNAPTWKTQGL